MTPAAEQSIINFVGMLLCIGFTAFLYLATRAKRTAPVVERAPEGDYYYATGDERVIAGKLAKGKHGNNS